MSDFKAKMHQIRFRLGLRPKPRWGSLQRSPRPLAGFKGPTSKGRGGEGREGERREEKGRGEVREGRERGGRGPISSAGSGPPKHVNTALGVTTALFINSGNNPVEKEAFARWAMITETDTVSEAELK